MPLETRYWPIWSLFCNSYGFGLHSGSQYPHQTTHPRGLNSILTLYVHMVIKCLHTFLNHIGQLIQDFSG